MLVWTDLETTGLDPKTCSVLEVACIVTNDKLAEVARFERVIYHPIAEHFAHLTGEEPDDVLQPLTDEFKVHPIVLRMHAKNGLWKLVAQSPHPRREVDEEFAAFLATHSIIWSKDEKTGKDRADRAQLAGSTISFDRGFMAEDLPLALKELHYRNVDVSTLNELGRRFWVEVYNARPKVENTAHRGMADIEESLRTCKHYLDHLAPQVIPVYGSYEVGP